MSEKPKLLELEPAKHYVVENNTGVKIEVEVITGNGTRIISTAQHGESVHVFPADGEKIDILYRWFDTKPRLRLV
ncbi:hypothetical protein IQ22_00398 [Pseudomonas duriflava]|uniref:Uncharacterized protein n=1 Tax=Pseudomonas duriflava TaxID=459528 RepID=A0A562QR61_9PSED|nr:MULTISPECIES: hypothetical protein [Pseudomonas]TWI58690.1 hypothetical protein IQ22_00398 [Pseudomonas duriflava]